mgnify:CR=1 FL=1
MTRVQNVPNYAMDYTFWVVRKVGSDLWFWGAYESEDTAANAAGEIGGLVVLHSIKGEAIL